MYRTHLSYINANNQKSTNGRRKKKVVLSPHELHVKMMTGSVPFMSISKARKNEPDPFLTAKLKEVIASGLKTQKQIAVDNETSQTTVSNYLNGASRAKGWEDLEIKFWSWIAQVDNETLNVNEVSCNISCNYSDGTNTQGESRLNFVNYGINAAIFEDCFDENLFDWEANQSLLGEYSYDNPQELFEVNTMMGYTTLGTYETKI